MAGCRDCGQCTEPMLASLLAFPIRLTWSLMTFWNIGLLRRKCPQCRHTMARHRMIGRRFQD